MIKKSRWFTILAALVVIGMISAGCTKATVTPTQTEAVSPTTQQPVVVEPTAPPVVIEPTALASTYCSCRKIVNHDRHCRGSALFQCHRRSNRVRFTRHGAGHAGPGRCG